MTCSNPKKTRSNFIRMKYIIFIYKEIETKPQKGEKLVVTIVVADITVVHYPHCCRCYCCISVEFYH